MLLLRSHTLLVLKGYRDKQARWHVAVPKAPGRVTAQWLETELPGSGAVTAPGLMIQGQERKSESTPRRGDPR